MACGLALLASGQAFAVPVEYYSTGAAGTTIGDADLINTAKWVAGAMNCGSGTAGTGTMPMAATDWLIVCPGHSLNLTAATVTAGTLVFDTTGAWGGTKLKFSPAINKQIINNNASLSSIALDISSMTTGNAITIGATGQPVTFSGVTGGSLSCTPIGGTAAAYTPGNPIAVGTSCAVTVVVVNNSVSAPIFSTKEKPAVFSEEVK